MPYGKLELMPVSMDFLRGVLGMISLGFAYMAGRSVAAVRKGWQKPSALRGWILRLAVCLVFVAFRNPLDLTDIGVFTLAALALGFGYWSTANRKPPEDLTHEIFPDNK
jgi:hypothetical protein